MLTRKMRCPFMSTTMYTMTENFTYTKQIKSTSAYVLRVKTNSAEDGRNKRQQSFQFR